MKIPYFCCIGAELKRYAKDFDFMNQVYLYKVPADDTMAEVLAQDYFMAVADTVLQDDIVYIYEPTTEILYTCHFNKQNGHITAEQMSNNIPSLTPDKILISDATGHITAGDVSLDYIKNQLLAKVNIDGSSIMTGPLKFKAGSFSGAIAGGLGDGISIYKLKADGTIDSEVASLTKTNGFTPGTTNAQNIGSSTLKWKDLYIARVITAVLNNGADIGIPTTGGTMALTSDIKNSTINVQLDGSAVDSFTLNQSSNKTINIPAANKDLSNLTPTGEAKFTAKANKDMDNLTSTGQNIANWSSNVTNCITEILQDINIVKNNDGSFTLKAGSKIYKPNGVDVFDIYTVPNDIIFSPTAFNDTYLYFLKSDGTKYNISDAKCFSGTTAPTGFSGNYAAWYDTTNNLIKYTDDAGSTWKTGLTFPIGWVNCTANTSLNIKNIFNGVGFIGSTLFVLPGLKGLIPNGFNADGSLKNTSINCTEVKTLTVNGNTSIYIALGSTGQPAWWSRSATEYKKHENKNYYNGNPSTFALCGLYNVKNNQIIDFDFNSVLHAVDYSMASNIGMPSDRYVDLTIGASDSSYTAPADGYVILKGQTTTTGKAYGMTNESNGMRNLIRVENSGNDFGVFLPVSKGQTYTVKYEGALASGYTFRFIYANCAK